MKQRASRGVTLLEVMATMTVMLLGVMAAMTVVSQTSVSNRRTLTANQAQVIAEQALERVMTLGCLNPNCTNLRDETYSVWQTAAGALRAEEPVEPGLVAREYSVNIDVDNPKDPTTMEGAKVGWPPLDRIVVAGQTGTIVNVRVSVSWDEPGLRSDRQMVVLQTRMAP
ncbi:MULTISPECIES: type IV pilus modification PilV family protein [unclassified Corallococcus]|uniref:type IV pilus modification PilV family protein n=1 Tax=unclassified Corallococcus TaxID=2685029 RepID=UPI001A8D1CFD|nr:MULTISPECIES: prepilin-type N-terminal cleavage/methylation domain-containing protein [unclassified Corallococcus]MBN9688240.1 prepilin-type N-terminal cleavage/methylation domain-containing protein [Corallococcus sp. NCSPR001]WAS87956.1 prepilin-type N-terminal cleavage/methylation domain-containing protein [Corallococcus sp. NCRR]